MDPSDIEVAIQISWNPGGDANIQAQALNFVNELRGNPQAWSPCLALFTRLSPAASDPVKHFCLEVVCNCIPHLDGDALEHIREQLVAHVQANYAGDTTPRDTLAIQNKFCQALTVLFVQLYPTTWQSFFYDFLTLTKNGANVPGTLLYFRLLLSIHDEIADVIIHRANDATKRNITLKDLVRDRDADKVAVFWHQMLARRQELDAVVLDLCLKSIGRWISWSDISLVVNETVLNALLELAGQQVSSWMVNETKVRDSALETFTEIASKKMRPAEKVELIGILKLDTVISGLIESSALKEQGRPDYDTDLAELVAKLVNNTIRDLVIVLDSAECNDQTKQQAHRILLTFLPFLLRFFSDDYDEVCSTVIDGFSEVLSFLRRLKDPAAAEYALLLPTFLQRVVAKMKYDDSATWSDIEEGDEPDFTDLRRRLQTLQKQIYAIDEQMTIGGISDLVQQTFHRLAENPSQVDWRDVDLAMYELHAYGDFAVKTHPIVAQRAGYAWDQLGLMMEQMMSCKVGSFNHPSVQILFTENCVRYSLFFEKNPNWIPDALESFVRFAHSGTTKTRGKTWGQFLRFVKTLRRHLGAVSEQIIQAISDLLVIKAAIPSDLPEDDDSATDVSEYEDSLFYFQVNLFEAIGCVASASTVSSDRTLVYIQSILNPLFNDMNLQLPAAKAGDERALMQMHHNIVAVGSFAHGFQEWKPGGKGVEPLGADVVPQFVRAGEVILVAAEALKQHKLIRQAARHCFSRVLGCTGNAMFPQLRPWMDCMVSPSSSKQEITFFLKQLAQIVFAFKKDIITFLGDNLSLLLERVFERMTEPPVGTDDENQRGELRREFMTFIGNCLGNGLGNAFILPQNQAIFEKTVAAIEGFAGDATDLPTGRQAIQTITRMIATWAGPAQNGISQNGGIINGGAIDPAAAEGIPGFDQFAITRLSLIAWAIPASPQFKPKDAGGRLLLQDVAALQQELYRRTGLAYAEALRAQLLGMGVGDADVQKYLEKLAGDIKGLREWVVVFLGGGK